MFFVVIHVGILQVDEHGAVTDLSGWQDTTHGDQNGPKAQGRFLGIGYNDKNDKRNLLTIGVSSVGGKLRQWDLGEGKLLTDVDVDDSRRRSGRGSGA